jgi:hypothetical protein
MDTEFYVNTPNGREPVTFCALTSPTEHLFQIESAEEVAPGEMLVHFTAATDKPILFQGKVGTMQTWVNNRLYVSEDEYGGHRVVFLSKNTMNNEIAKNHSVDVDLHFFDSKGKIGESVRIGSGFGTGCAKAIALVARTYTNPVKYAKSVRISISASCWWSC